MRTLICEVEGCENLIRHKNLCAKHYTRFRRHKTTDFVGRITIPSKVRFENEICYIEVYDNKGNIVNEATIDTEDYEKIKDYRFHQSIKCSNPYVKTNTGDYLHNLILNETPSGLEIDHKDRNTLNNCKSNLRFASRQQQGMNVSKQRRPLTSQYKGVHWDNNRNKWKAEIKLNQEGRYIGRFENEHQAAEAYNEEALKLFGEFAVLNKIVRRRGRPKNFRMTEESKQKTSNTMKGRKHSLQTRLKISQSVIKYWEDRANDKTSSDDNKMEDA
jgi:hypothetical protein